MGTAAAGERIAAYDLARSFAIAIVFVGHIVVGQTTNSRIEVVSRALSPGLTMSLLGFISAALLSTRSEGAGEFLLKRFTRIYLALFTCLSLALIVQAILGTLKADMDIVFHFLGLTGFFELLSIRYNNSVGQGLWFVTTILSMYLLLPALQRVFAHRRGLIHLLIAIGLSLVAYRWMYAAGAWNVVIAFCIGTYLGVNGGLEALERRPAPLYFVFACCVLGVCALASSRVIPFWIRGLLPPLYPLVFVPLFFAAARVLPHWTKRVFSGFAAVSYEFYILHFYFIGESFDDLFGGSTRIALEILISFAVVLALATALHVVNSRLRRPLDAYLLESQRDRGELGAR